MPVADGDVLQIRQASSFNDDFQFLNVFYAEVVTAPSGGDDDVLTDLDTWVDSVISPLLAHYPDSWDTDPSDVLNLTQDEFVGTVSTELVGTGTGDALPFQVAALVLGKTADRGHTARKYFGPFTEASCTDGIWTTACQDQLVLAGVAWETDPASATDGVYRTGVYNTREIPTPIFRPIIRSKVIGRSRTQRSRTRAIRF